MYSKKVMTHFKNPKFAGEIKDADGIGEEGNIRCGDEMRIFIKVKNDRIDKIKFQTYGCVAAISATDALCQIAKGKSLEEAEALKYSDIITELKELPPIKHHCSIMGTTALKRAIEDYRKRKSSDRKSVTNTICGR